MGVPSNQDNNKQLIPDDNIPAFDPSKRYKAGADYILREVAGTNVLISIGGNIADFNGYIQLNETAAFLWKELSVPKTADELIQALTNEFDVSAEQADTAVCAFLTELVRDKMVAADG